MENEFKHPWLDRDLTEQYIIEHMTFKGGYLCSERLTGFVDEQIPDDQIFSQELYDEALKVAEKIVLDLGYKKIRRGYVFNSP